MMEAGLVVICKPIILFFVLLCEIALAGMYLMSDYKFVLKRIYLIKSFSLGIFLAFSLMILLRNADSLFKQNYFSNYNLDNDNDIGNETHEYYDINPKKKLFPYAFLICFSSITVNFILEKLLFEPKVQWMRKAKYQWEFENLKVQLDKKSVSEYKDCEESQTILGEHQLNEMKEKLKKKLDLNLKSEKIINKTLYNIKEILDLTIYDTLESDDYIEVMEHKFKKTICLFSVFIYSLKILNSKKTISEKILKPYNSINIECAGLAIFLQLFFLGTSVGLQNDITSFLSISIGVLIYKMIKSIELGSIFQPHYHNRRKFFILILIYSLTTPFGIGIGWLIDSIKEKNLIAKAVFLAISSGNMLFLVAFKGCIEEFFLSRLSIKKGVGFFFGVLLVIVLMNIPIFDD